MSSAPAAPRPLRALGPGEGVRTVTHLARNTPLSFHSACGWDGGESDTRTPASAVRARCAPGAGPVLGRRGSPGLSGGSRCSEGVWLPGASPGIPRKIGDPGARLGARRVPWLGGRALGDAPIPGRAPPADRMPRCVAVIHSRPHPRRRRRPAVDPLCTEFSTGGDMSGDEGTGSVWNGPAGARRREPHRCEFSTGVDSPCGQPGGHPIPTHPTHPARPRSSQRFVPAGGGPIPLTPDVARRRFRGDAYYSEA